MRELTNYEQWQQERYGDILPTPYILENEEPGEREATRFSEWFELQHELQLNDFDKD